MIIWSDKVHFFSRLQGIRWAIQSGRDHEGLKKLEKKIQIDLSKILHQEELLWYHRAKVNWIVDGDRNTKFYHTRVVQQRRGKIINMLKDNDNNWIEDGEEIKSMFQFHLKIFSQRSSILLSGFKPLKSSIFLTIVFPDS